MPVAEFPGRVRLGLRRRRPVRADRALRPPGRLPPLRRRGARARPRRHPRRRLQPLRPRRQLPRAVLATATSPRRYENEWGEAINFDGADAGPVREFFAANAAYWIDEFHLDGLRLDATQAIYDDSPEHILADIDARRARGAPAGDRSSSSARTSRSTRRLVRPPEQGGYGLDALWNDDFHHTRDGRADRAQRGLLQRLPRHAAGVHLRGEVRLPLPGPALRLAGASAAARPALDLPPAALRRLPPEPRPGRQLGTRRAAAPADEPRPRPGDDGAAAAVPRHADAVPGAGVRARRRRSSTSPTTSRSWRGSFATAGTTSWRQFPSVAAPEMQRAACRSRRARDASSAASSTGASASATPTRSRSTATCCACGARTRPSPGQRQGGLDGAVLGPEAFVLRYFGEGGDDRLLLVNLGRDLERRSHPRAAAGAAGRPHLDAPLVERTPALRRRRHAGNRDEGALAHRRSRRRRARRRSRRAGLSRRSGRDGTLTLRQRCAGPCRSPERGIRA